MNEETEKIWYSAREAAEYLGINLNRLARLRRQGRVKGQTGGGENTRYSWYHIDDLRAADTTDLRKKEKNDEDSTGEEPDGNAHGASVPLKGRRGNRYEELALVGA